MAPDPLNAKSAASTEKEPASENQDFSLVLGGPLYQLFVRTRLVVPPMELVHRRILAFLLLTWLPLVVLSVIEGTFAGEVNVPFLFDLANIRLLIALPILIGAEPIVHRRIRMIVDQFLGNGPIAPKERSRYKALIDRTMALRNSITAEIVLIVLAFTGGHLLWAQFGILHVTTWYKVSLGGSTSLSWAGWWFAYVSLPIARFILLRWYFRLFIWYLFLWRVSRIPLRLNPLHPDRAGGLGFLGKSVEAFAPILIAQSIFLAVMIGNQILHEGAKLPDFKFAIGGYLVFLMLLVLFPLLFFVFQMLEAKLTAHRDFDQLANRYVNDFRQKWLADGKTPEESVLGTSDIQSLADLANSYEVVRMTHLLPFDNKAVVRLAVLLLIPLLPLALTMVSLAEIAERLIKLLL